MRGKLLYRGFALSLLVVALLELGAGAVLAGPAGFGKQDRSGASAAYGLFFGGRATPTGMAAFGLGATFAPELKVREGLVIQPAYGCDFTPRWFIECGNGVPKQRDQVLGIGIRYTW